jgi:hypothetical protein
METITVNGKTYTAAEDAERRPRVLRHHMSGVWICYVLSEGSRPDTLLIEGRRLWSWSGRRLETSQLATKGYNGGKIGDWVMLELGQISEHLIDAIVTTDEIVQACKGAPEWQG